MLRVAWQVDHTSFWPPVAPRSPPLPPPHFHEYRVIGALISNTFGLDFAPQPPHLNLSMLLPSEPMNCTLCGLSCASQPPPMATLPEPQDTSFQSSPSTSLISTGMYEQMAQICLAAPKPPQIQRVPSSDGREDWKMLFFAWQPPPITCMPEPQASSPQSSKLPVTMTGL